MYFNPGNNLNLESTQFPFPGRPPPLLHGLHGPGYKIQICGYSTLCPLICVKNTYILGNISDFFEKLKKRLHVFTYITQVFEQI